MASYMDKDTDQKLAALERRLASTYSQAQKEMNVTIDRYVNGWDELKFDDFTGKTYNVHHEGMNERYNREMVAFNNGVYGDPTEKASKDKFNRWWAAQEGRKERFESVADEMAKRITEANVAAADHINGCSTRVYANNHNYTAYEIEKGSGISFNLLDESTVRRLSDSTKRILPKANINVPKDQSWNRMKLQGALLQGILQGDSPYQIADRFQQVTNMNRSSAIRNARTAITGSQNAGRLDCYAEAAEMGIELEKEWICTNDDRTRESHIELDGIRVPWDEDFPNGLEYPGDPKGDPCEVYNCRCTMRAVLPKYDNANAHITGNTTETYKEWQERKLEEYANQHVRPEGWHIDTTDPKYNLHGSFENVTIDSSEVKAMDLDEGMKSFIEEYTDGHYSQVCEYAQYLTDGKPTAEGNNEFWVKNVLPEIDSKTKENTEKLLKIIEEQNISYEPLYRIDRFNSNIPEIGEELEIGIRSVSRDSDFVEKVLNGSENSLFGDEGAKPGKIYTEYIFENGKRFDIDELSVYPDQKESLITGKYIVDSVEMAYEPIEKGWISTTYTAEEWINKNGFQYEKFTSKKGSEMFRYYEDGKEKTIKVDAVKTEDKYTSGKPGLRIVRLHLK